MRPYCRFSTLHQLALSVCAFAAVALLVDSGGLARWADRLDLGPERTLALPVTSALHRDLAWLGLERLRHAELLSLARIGWSDDPAALAEVRAPKILVLPPPVTMATNTTAPKPTAAPTVAPPKPQPTPRPPRPMIGDPPLISTLPSLPPVQSGKTRTIALAGDSMMAVGLSSTLLREAPQYTDLALLRAFKSGTGLARPEVFDWQTEYPAMLRDAHPDFVLVAIGANDGQGFEHDGTVYPFGTDGWKTLYQARVQAYLDLLESSGATVIWLGLPPMKSDLYDARIALINRIDYAVVQASPHAIWVSTAGLVGDSEGRFQDFGDIGGKTVRLRQGDGIHLSDDGGSLVAHHLLPWLAAQAPPPLPPPPPAPEPGLSPLPPSPQPQPTKKNPRAAESHPGISSNLQASSDDGRRHPDNVRAGLPCGTHGSCSNGLPAHGTPRPGEDTRHDTHSADQTTGSHGHKIQVHRGTTGQLR